MVIEKPAQLKVNLHLILNYLNVKADRFSAGSIKQHIHEWRQLTSDIVILNTVTGITLAHDQVVFDNKNTYINVPKKQRDIIGKEIQCLLDKKVITSCNHEI